MGAENAQAVLQELESLGSEQTRKTYRRHGVMGDQYGVQYADMDRLSKRIKTDHELAQELWNTGVHDARILATRIADPNRLDADLLHRWAAGLNNYVLCDALAGLAAKTPQAQEVMEEWMRSDEEWIGRTGWLMLANRVMDEKSPLTEEVLEQQLRTIEREIHGRKNRVRDAMNTALIAIGIRTPSLNEKALAAAQRIGKVEVDHGDTACKTPAAVPYIHKAWEHKQAKQAKKAKQAA